MWDALSTVFHRVSTQYIIFYFVVFLFCFVSRAHSVCRNWDDGKNRPER